MKDDNNTIPLDELRLRVAVKWIRDLKEIESLEAQWRDLELKVINRTTASCFDWVVSWYHHYASFYGEPLLGVATQDDKLLAIAPLVARKATLNMIPVTSADFVGFNAESGEFLITDGMEEIINLFLGTLLDYQGIDVISLNGFESDSGEFYIVRKFFEQRNLNHKIIFDRYAMVDLKDGHLAYFSSLTSKLRNSYNRQKRKITEAGQWEIEQLSGNVGEEVVRDGIERVYSIYNRSWKAIKNGEMGEPHVSFYREAVLKFSKRGMISINFLKLDNKDIAFVLWLVERNCYYDVMVSYDDAYASLSPGIFLMHEILKGLPEENIHTVISHGNREYKKNWVTAFVTRYRIFIFNKSFKSTLSNFVKFRIPELIENLKR